MAGEPRGNFPQAWIDENGEVHDDLSPVVVWTRRHARNGFTLGWLAMGQPALAELALKIRSAEDWRVFATVSAFLDYENDVGISQAEIARHLGMQRSHVSRSFRRLIELGVLVEGERRGRSKSYRLAPAVGWKGSAKTHHAALRERGLHVIEGGKKKK